MLLLRQSLFFLALVASLNAAEVTQSQISDKYSDVGNNSTTALEQEVQNESFRSLIQKVDGITLGKTDKIDASIIYEALGGGKVTATVRSKNLPPDECKKILESTIDYLNGRARGVSPQIVAAGLIENSAITRNDEPHFIASKMKWVPASKLKSLQTCSRTGQVLIDNDVAIFFRIFKTEDGDRLISDEKFDPQEFAPGSQAIIERTKMEVRLRINPSREPGMREAFNSEVKRKLLDWGIVWRSPQDLLAGSLSE